VYVAKLRMSEMFWFMGDHELARRYFHEASELKKRFNDRYWMPDKNFFAMGLDSQRKQINSISSNPGHLLACGIVHKELASSVAHRLLQRDMFSGWESVRFRPITPPTTHTATTVVPSGRWSTEASRWDDAVRSDQGTAHHRSRNFRSQHTLRLQPPPRMLQRSSSG
jgi:hypothetical protein